jgi:SNF2 family DNA or RNA helicase
VSVLAPKTKYRPYLELGDKCLQLFSRFEDKELCKLVFGARWNAKDKCWKYPLRPETLRHLVAIFPGLSVDPKVRLAVTEIQSREALAAQIKAEGWQNTRPAEPMPIRTKPFKHQIAAFNMALNLPAAALLMEQGTGKSLTAIAIAGRRFLRGEIQRCLIVAPASVVPVWPLEFSLHADFLHEVLALEGPVSKREQMLREWAPDPNRLQVAVINYEATWRMEEALVKWQPDLIICDESQRIKTPGAKQSKCLHKLGRQAKYRLILTGTPVTQGPLDIFSQYKFLEPSIFGTSYYAFRARYAILGGYEGKQVIGYKYLPELIQNAHSIAFRVTKEACLDLPPFTDQVLYCELERKALSIYAQLRRESVAELSTEQLLTATNILSKLLRLSQITGGFLGDGEGGIVKVSTAKMMLLEETLDDLLDAGKKVVIFARFLPEIHAIRRHLGKQGIVYSWIAGEVKQAERGEMVRRFQEDPECRVFLAQIQTAGLGITLTAADTAILYSLDYSFANYDQARARLHRIGQRNAVTYIHLVARGTVDEKVLQALKSKKSVADEVIDNWRNYFEGVF